MNYSFVMYTSIPKNESTEKDFSNNLFFCSGLPKSGTTFLQRLINLHPQISCPSEQGLRFIYNQNQYMYETYNKLLNIADKRTGGQGICQISQDTVERIFKYHVHEIAVENSGGKPIIGLNDNWVCHNLTAFRQRFPNSLFIQIFRNPADRAVSLWDHNFQLYKKEGDRKHLEFLNQFDGTIEGCVLYCAQKDSEYFWEICEKHSHDTKILFIRYEDLCSEDISALSDILAFLGAECDPSLLKKLKASSKIEKFARLSENRDFFAGGGRVGFADGVVKDDVRQQAFEIAAKSLERLGYTFDGWPRFD